MPIELDELDAWLNRALEVLAFTLVSPRLVKRILLRRPPAARSRSWALEALCQVRVG